MRRWTPIAVCAVAGLALGVTLNGVILNRNSMSVSRIDALGQAIATLADRIQAMEDPPENTTTTEVPCPKTGLTNTVCTPRKAGESDADYTARHMATVQAFIDACEDR